METDKAIAAPSLTDPIVAPVIEESVNVEGGGGEPEQAQVLAVAKAEEHPIPMPPPLLLPPESPAAQPVPPPAEHQPLNEAMAAHGVAVAVPQVGEEITITDQVRKSISSVHYFICIEASPVNSHMSFFFILFIRMYYLGGEDLPTVISATSVTVTSSASIAKTM